MAKGQGSRARISLWVGQVEALQHWCILALLPGRFGIQGQVDSARTTPRAELLK